MSKRNEAARERLAQIARNKGLPSAGDNKPVEKTRAEIADEDNKKCVELISKGRYEEAFAFGNKALKSVKAEFNLAVSRGEESFIIEKCKEALGEIYYNLALSKQNIAPGKALSYLEEAYKNKPQDQEIIYKQWYCNFILGNYDKSIEAANRLLTPVKGLLVIQSNLHAGKITPQKAKHDAKNYINKASTLKEKGWYFKVMTDIELGVGNYKEAISCIKESQKLITPGQIGDLLSLVQNVLAIYCGQGDFTEGLAYLKAIRGQHPVLNNCDTNPYGNYYEFLLYENTQDKAGAAALLEKINKEAEHSFTHKKCADLANQAHFYTELENGNLERAKACLEKTSLNIHFYRELFATLQKGIILNKSAGKVSEGAPPLESFDKELAIAMIEARAGEKAAGQEAVEAPAKVAKPAVVLEEEHEPQEQDVQTPKEEQATLAIEPWQDPRAIHAYFQRKKALLDKKIFEEFNNVKHVKETSWVLSDGQKIGLKNVYKVANSENFYVYIKDGICVAEQLKAFTDAITIKGMVHRKDGQNGVKYCSGNGLAEVKIAGDARMWTDLTIRNEDGKYLLVMKRSGNHAAFAKAERDSKMRVEKVSACGQYDANPDLGSECKRQQQSDLECKKATDYLDKYPDEEDVVTITGGFGYPKGSVDAFYDENL